MFHPEPIGRKTVPQSPRACHKKFLPHRETRSLTRSSNIFRSAQTRRNPIMDDTHTEHGHGPNGPAKAVSQLSDSVAHTTEKHRALMQEMTQFAKDEGLRFVNLRLERNGQALDKLQHCHGIPGLISVQQEWLRDFVQDYIGQNMRMAGALRGLTQNVMACASEQAQENIERAQHAAKDMAHEAAQQVSHATQEASNYVQQTQH